MCEKMNRSKTDIYPYLNGKRITNGGFWNGKINLSATRVNFVSFPNSFQYLFFEKKLSTSSMFSEEKLIINKFSIASV